LTFQALGRILKYMLNHPINLDRVFQALADPTRRGMLERLGRAPATVSELAAPIAISLAAVVQHVQILEASGLVRTEKIGRTRTCHIDTNTLAAAEQWLEARRSQWNTHLDRLGDYLDGSTGDRTADRPTRKKE
jgi:DNA-binding transcriptional ArsR family regulator